jgi:hypothetical protein
VNAKPQRENAAGFRALQRGPRGAELEFHRYGLEGVAAAALEHASNGQQKVNTGARIVARNIARFLWAGAMVRHRSLAAA